MESKNKVPGLFRALGFLVLPILAVRSSKTKPLSAFVTVFYRGHWFYVEDNDPSSKATFGLLNQLFSLQASPEKALAPLVTIPAR